MIDQSLQMAVVSTTIFHLTGINTVVLDRDGSVHFAHEHDHLPDFLVEIQHKDFLFLWLEAERQLNQCCMYTNEWGFSYLASLFKVDGEERKILIHGPFLKQTPDLNKLYAKFKIEQKKQIILKEFARGLKIISSARIQSIANVLQQAGSIHPAALRIINTPHDSSKRFQQTYTDGSILQQPDEKYAELIELRYELEKEMTHAVEKGDKLKLREILSKGGNLFDFSDRFPNQPVRAMKNMLIVLNTLFRIAAENGKVQPFFLHYISEKFSTKIERVESINSLNELRTVMSDEYCDLVRNHAISGYSLLVQKAVTFLTVHFSKPLNLKKIAQYCLVHPSHLSRQFKKETGMTLTDFLHKLRIEEAKLMLKKDRTSIDWIAGYVGFDDAGYFTRVFKKLEGVTPSEYRNSNSRPI